jgi:competence protein ComEC
MVSSRFTFYPLFRLSVALATGIFLSDVFALDGTYLYALCFVFVLSVLLSSIFYFSKTYRIRFLFGISVSLSFLLLGGILFVISLENIHHEWDSDKAVYVASVCDIPRVKGKTIQATVNVEKVKDVATGSWKPVNKQILLYWMPDSMQPPLQCGDRICFRAHVGMPMSDADFTGFDYGQYLQRQGISGTAIVYSGYWRKLLQPSTPTFKMQALMLREQIVKKFRTWSLEDDVLAIISALTVGDKSKLTREIKATYNAAGVSHILALSGLHIGILSMILSWLFYPLRRVCGGKWIAGFLIVGLLWGFAFLSGLSPSVIRAVTMFSAYVVASIFSEDRFSGFSALTLTAFIMLIYQPMYLFDVGFQLSFMAVFGIFLFYPLIDSLFVVRNKIVAYLWNIISLSLAAQLATLPLILYYFGTFPVYFLLSNLVVAPIAVFILSATLLALALGVFPVAANFVVQGLDFAVRTLNEVMGQIQHWSGAQITSAYLSVWQAWLLAVAIVTLWRYVVCRSACRLIVFLLTVNVLIVSFLWKQRELPGTYIYLSRAGVYTKYDRDINELSSASCIYKVRDICIVLVDNNKWRKQKALSPLHVDYAYICRGFYGSVADLKRLFQIKQVVLDISLEDSYREKLKRECEIYGLNYIDMSEKGSYAILL